MKHSINIAEEINSLWEFIYSFSKFIHAPTILLKWFLTIVKLSDVIFLKWVSEFVNVLQVIQKYS